MMATAPPQDSTTGANAGKSAPSPAAPVASRHAEFYFTDEMTVFQVESRLFRVHRHFLSENSLLFSSMFSLPRGAQVGSMAPEGTSDANPIHLPGVTELEFETLLRFFYKSIYEGFALPQASWIALLSIAHRYEFLNVRERAIREIYGPYSKPKETGEHNDNQMLLSVAEKYEVPLKYIVPLLLPFVIRGQPLTEGEVLGFSALTVSRLAHAREVFQREYRSNWRSDAKEIVNRIWQVQNDG